ncbi:M23 family metallopeptidase [Devosia sp.]|uniref:M23 family metallopeptidase n=1 Tax=Devosia sp. TaxID=1871048 RepID=UPI003F71D32E
MRAFGIDEASAEAYVRHRSSSSERHRSRLLSLAGYSDEPALTLQSTEGAHPNGRELSFSWLVGTVMTGLTSVLLMGAALYVSFEGQDTFSTAYEALQLITKPAETVAESQVKGDRVRPIAQTRSELEVVEASIREIVDGRSIIRNQPFVRIRATLATAATTLSGDIPNYDPVAMIDASQPVVADGDDVANPDIYGAEVDGEVQIKTAALPATYVPAPAISDKSASAFVRLTVENLFAEGGGEGETALAYAAPDTGVRDLGIVTDGDVSGVAENVSVLPKTKLAEQAGLGRSERVVTIRDTGSLKEPLLKNGFDTQTYDMIAATLKNVLQSTNVPSGARLRILMGPARNSQTLIPHRLSIYFPDPKTGEIKHAATAALTDRGNYVLGLEPPKIEFPEEDTEEINVNNLPSVYRSIWETARKHEVPDAITSRIVAMFAYDVDLTKKIAAGDSIDILETDGTSQGRELLYVALKLGDTIRELYRFRSDDGSIEFYDPAGETGKRFLIRRPVKGGGRLASRFGYRVHPIFKTRKLHTGADFASPLGTPIYAAGDGVIDRAQWVSGYGKYVQLTHVNGYVTAYGHMSRIADGIKPGVAVRQGQVIGYVGSTGNSTGNHLHFEVRVNGRPVDPLSVKLPRDKALPAQSQAAFAQTVAQIRDLMQRPSGALVAARHEP